MNKEDFIKAAEPLIKWLNENGNPHKCVIVRTDGAEVFEGFLVHQTDEFIND